MPPLRPLRYKHRSYPSQQQPYQKKTRSHHANHDDNEEFDPDAFFREALFSSITDPAAAKHWEEVYGQPLHIYSRTQVSQTGKTVVLDDDAFVEFVKEEMWKNTSENLERQRSKAKQEREWRNERSKLQEKLKEYRKAKLRKQGILDEDQTMVVEEEQTDEVDQPKVNAWELAWDRYDKGWTALLVNAETVRDNHEGRDSVEYAHALIPWPVLSGQFDDVTKESVEEFFQKAPPANVKILPLLKTDRIRWHPDKMQQQFGAKKLDGETLQHVTAVFQIIDRMYKVRSTRM
jgi:hypothetical protein